MIIYLAGPITGVTNFEKNFMDAEDRWRRLGHMVLNPVTLCGGIAELRKQMTEEELWRYCMVKDFDLIMHHAEGIALLGGWQDSTGANAEVYMATLLNKPLFDAETMQPLILGIKYRIVPGGFGISRDEEAIDVISHVKHFMSEIDQSLSPPRTVTLPQARTI